MKSAFCIFQKTEIRETISERSTKEDCNDLSTFSDKKLNNKSIKTYANNSRNPLVLNSHEKYPVSPRRRFLSTGSYDSHQQFPFSSNKIVNELSRQSRETDILSDVGNVKNSKDDAHKEDCVKFLPLTLENVENFSAPTRLSPLFSHNESLSPALSGIEYLDQTETVEVI